jgi:hypothetical protein
MKDKFKEEKEFILKHQNNVLTDHYSLTDVLWLMNKYKHGETICEEYKSKVKSRVEMLNLMGGNPSLKIITDFLSEEFNDTRASTSMRGAYMSTYFRFKDKEGNTKHINGIEDMRIYLIDYYTKQINR